MVLAMTKKGAGFILEEVCGLRDPRIESWLEFATGGGSRKLDAAANYAPKFYT